jgi:hypothetical protein
LVCALPSELNPKADGTQANAEDAHAWPCTSIRAGCVLILSFPMASRAANYPAAWRALDITLKLSLQALA